MLDIKFSTKLKNFKTSNEFYYFIFFYRHTEYRLGILSSCWIYYSPYGSMVGYYVFCVLPAIRSMEEY